MKHHIYFLDQHPFTAPLDELVEHHAHISQCEAAHIETKELGGMSRAELQADMRRGRMLQTRIFNLLGNLIYSWVRSQKSQVELEDLPRT